MKKISSSDVAGILGALVMLLVVLAIFGGIIYAFIVDPPVMLIVIGVFLGFYALITTPSWIAWLWNLFVDMMDSTKKKYKE